MTEFFKTILYEPIYNLLVLLTGLLPGGDVGLAIIILTILVRLALFPLEHRRAKMQRAMQTIQPELEQIKKKFGADRERLARQTMELYRRHGLNPFSTLLVSLIQIPILLTLFFVFRSGLPFDEGELYSFVKLPQTVNTVFLSLFNLQVPAWPLALFAGLTQFVQARLAVPALPRVKVAENPSFADTMSRSMNLNMRYIFPGLITVIALGFPAALVLYWITNNLFMIAHELLVKRRAREAAQVSNF